MDRDLKLKAFGLVAITVVVVVALVAILAGQKHHELSIQPKGTPALADVNRTDAKGAATVTAFVKAGLSCTPEGRELMNRLSAGGALALRQRIAKACKVANGTWASLVYGDVEGGATADLVRWKLLADSDNLGGDPILELKRSGGSWVVS